MSILCLGRYKAINVIQPISGLLQPHSIHSLHELNSHLKFSTLLKWISWLFFSIFLVNYLLLLLLLCVSVRHIRGSRSSKSIGLFGLLLDFAAIKLHLVIMQREPLNHSITHALHKGNKQWMNILSIIKPIQHGLHTKHTNPFTWDVPMGIYRGNRMVLLRVNNFIVSFI